MKVGVIGLGTMGMGAALIEGATLFAVFAGFGAK